METLEQIKSLVEALSSETTKFFEKGNKIQGLTNEKLKYKQRNMMSPKFSKKN